MIFMTIKQQGMTLVGVALILLMLGGAPAFAQHQGHDMPVVSKPKPRVRKARAVRKKRVTVKKKRRVAAKKRVTPASPAAQPAREPTHTNMPGMNMPGHQMPGHQMSPSPSPQPSPQPHMHTPEMQMPSATPSTSPIPSTAPLPSMAPHTHAMPAPAASPGTPTDVIKPEPMDHSKHAAGEMKSMPGMGPMKMGPLLVMTADEMGIRVGSSDTNIMSMGQMGSGTSWAPASTPMYMWHKVAGDWLLMLHAEAKTGINSQGGPRGVTKFESANWLMPMAFRKLGRGTLQLRGMFSFEPFTFPPGGSPLLFQTGETYKGQPIIDRQHPHDLFMELSAQYTHPLGERGTWFTYFGYPGEPALGPPAFMHRASASENSSATLSHHLQDSTHISFGVFTTGFTYRWFKLEGSIFNGHEPDENRYDFDTGKWDSRSARLSFAPNRNWSMQVSYGFLRKPEAAEPDTDIRRTTASMHYNKTLDRGYWASAFIWGRNHATGGHDEVHNVNGYTLESTVNFQDKNYAYTRLELVDKNELLRAFDRAFLGITDEHPSFRIGAFTFGAARDIWNSDKISMAIGGDFTFYSKPAVLDSLYGNQPVSWKLFLRLRPAKMTMSAMH
jgi:hypothetical protein